MSLSIARTGNLSQWQDQLGNCYWRRNGNCPEHPFIDASAPTKKLYFVSITNLKCYSFGHAVVGEQINLTDIIHLDHWKFIQWGNLNITPGGVETDEYGNQIYQMPLGCIINENGIDVECFTKVEIQKITSLSIVNCEITKTFDPLITFYIDHNGNSTYVLPNI